MPTRSDVRGVASVPMANVLVSFTPGIEEYNAIEQIAPLRLVNPEKDGSKYPIEDSSKLRYEDINPVADNVDAPEIDWGYDWQDYSLVGRRRRAPIRRRDERAQQSGINVRRDRARVLAIKLAVWRAKQLGIYMNLSTNFHADCHEQLTGNDQFSATATSKPDEKIEACARSVKNKIYSLPNTLVFGGNGVREAVVKHPRMRGLVYGSGSDKVVQDQDLRVAFPWAKNVVTLDMMYDTSAEGATESPGYIFGKHIWCVYADPTVLEGIYNRGWVVQLFHEMPYGLPAANGVAVTEYDMLPTTGRPVSYMEAYWESGIHRVREGAAGMIEDAIA